MKQVPITKMNPDKSEDDEEDYMSDKFLQEAPSDSKTKTSLLFSHKQRYEHQVYKRKLQSLPTSKRSMKQLEDELRQAALNKPMLNSENKGFQLLQKMIAKKQNDKSITATDQTSSMTIEKLVAERKPIDIEIRSGRKGLGHETKRQRLTATQTKKSETSDLNPAQFRRLKGEQSDMFLTKKDYFDLQKICYNLDSKKGISEPNEEWYWPRVVIEEKIKKNKRAEEVAEDSPQSVPEECSGDEPEEEEIDYKTRMEELESFVRSEYFYCLWCGCQFESKEDLEQNCPGNTRQDH